MVPKRIVDKLRELDQFQMDECTRVRDEWQAAHEKFLRGEIDCPPLEVVPYFNSGFVLKVVETSRVVSDGGEYFVSFHHEWDHEAINGIEAFTEGARWANEHGAEIPISA